MFVGAGDKVLLIIKLCLSGVMPPSDQVVRKAKRGGADREFEIEEAGADDGGFADIIGDGKNIFGARDRFEIILYKNVCIGTRCPTCSWAWVGCSTILPSEQAYSAQFLTAQASTVGYIQPINQTKVKEQR